MLKKAQRIPRGQFEVVFRTGKRLHSLLCQLIYMPTTGPAFSVVVSKKVAKQAVARNRLRRRVYGETERFLKASPSPITHQGIFILKPDAAKSSKAQLQADIEGLLAQMMKTR